MKLSILAAVLLSCPATAVWAQETNPPILMQPAESEVAGRTIDIQGLVPGMSVEVASAIIQQVIGRQPNNKMAQTRVREGVATATSVPFVEWVDGGVAENWLTVQFSGISSGNRAVLIARDDEYADAANAPLYDGLIASLLQKYGTPTFHKEGMEGFTIMWTFKDGAPAPCDPQGYPQCLAPQSAFNMLEMAVQQHDVIVHASILRALEDRSRVSAFKMRSTNLHLKVAADEADLAGMRKALDEALAESSVSSPAPVL